MTGNPLWDMLERPSRWDAKSRRRRDMRAYLRAAGQDAPSMELVATALAGYASTAPSELADRLNCRLLDD